MPWGYVAGAIVTGVMAGEASDRADDRADTRAATANENNDELLAFEKEKYQDWKDIYGDIEQNLADFYENMTPEFLTSAGLEEEAKSFSTAQTQIKTQLAQRGLGGSGLEADFIARQEVQSAENRATIRRDSPLKVAEAQQNFLTPNLAGKTNAGNSVSAAMQRGAATQDSILAASAQRADDNAASLWNSTGSIIGAGLKEYANRPAEVDIKSV